MESEKKTGTLERTGEGMQAQSHDGVTIFRDALVFTVGGVAAERPRRRHPGPQDAMLSTVMRPSCSLSARTRVHQAYHPPAPTPQELAEQPSAAGVRGAALVCGGKFLPPGPASSPVLFIFVFFSFSLFLPLTERQ